MNKEKNCDKLYFLDEIGNTWQKQYKRETTQITNIRNESKTIITDPMDTKR
jgi:hypothetical protein